MADTAWSNGASPDDGWTPATSVRSTAADDQAPRQANTRGGGRRRRPPGEPPPPTLNIDAYAGSPWGPGTVAGARPAPPTAVSSTASAAAASAAGAAWPSPARSDEGYADPPTTAIDRYTDGPTPAIDRRSAAESALTRLRAAVPQVQQRGLPGWGALLVQIVITILGVVIDAMRGVQLGTWFNVGILVGAVVSILLVRRSGMFPVVVAPPIVYSLTAGVSLYIRSGGLSDHNVLIDAATNWLVYGFPTIAAATAAVLIIAGVRMITRR